MKTYAFLNENKKTFWNPLFNWSLEPYKSNEEKAVTKFILIGGNQKLVQIPFNYLPTFVTLGKEILESDPLEFLEALDDLEILDALKIYMYMIYKH